MDGRWLLQLVRLLQQSGFPSVSQRSPERSGRHRAAGLRHHTRTSLTTIRSTRVGILLPGNSQKFSPMNFVPHLDPSTKNSRNMLIYIYEEDHYYDICYA